MKPPPKAKKAKAKKKPAPKPTTPAEDWQQQFFKLAEVLGKNPEEMITAYCRGWVEATRARALAESGDE